VAEIYPVTCIVVKYICFPHVYNFCSGTSLTVLITRVIRCTTWFNIKIFYISPTECIHVFCIIFTIKNHSSTRQHLPLVFQWRESVLTLCRNWICIHVWTAWESDIIPTAILPQYTRRRRYFTVLRVLSKRVTRDVVWTSVNKPLFCF